MRLQIRERRIEIAFCVFFVLVFTACGVILGRFLLGSTSPAALLEGSWFKPGIGWIEVVPLLVILIFILGALVRIIVDLRFIRNNRFESQRF